MQHRKPPPPPRRPVHGVLMLDKPLGLSSNDALQKARRLYRAEKAGHTGTLDPLATGLLPICFGASTKFSQVGLDADKRYLATLRLGITTTTGDAEGDVLETRPVQVEREQIEAAIGRFLGEIEQLPPMHSALKRDGRPLYDYARAGIELERETRRVTIRAIALLGPADSSGERPAALSPDSSSKLSSDSSPKRSPDSSSKLSSGSSPGSSPNSSPGIVSNSAADVWRIDVRCSKGTYIRTLAEDIGRALGCGAHLVGLRRLETGASTLDGAVTLDALAAMTEAERDAVLRPADALLADWPQVRLDASEAGRFLSGLRRRLPLADAAGVRVYGPEPAAFLGGARITAGELIPIRILSPAEVGGLLDTPSATPPDTTSTKAPAP